MTSIDCPAAESAAVNVSDDKAKPPGNVARTLCPSKFMAKSGINASLAVITMVLPVCVSVASINMAYISTRAPSVDPSKSLPSPSVMVGDPPDTVTIPVSSANDTASNGVEVAVTVKE